MIPGYFLPDGQLLGRLGKLVLVVKSRLRSKPHDERNWFQQLPAEAAEAYPSGVKWIVSLIAKAVRKASLHQALCCLTLASAIVSAVEQQDHSTFLGILAYPFYM